MPTEPRRPRSATVLFAAALLLFVVGSVVAWWQPPRLFPLKPQTTAEWWLQPLENNAFQRMPRIDEDLSDVFVVPKTGEVWAVGEKGLIVHSRDGGRTWKRAKTGFGSSLSTEQPKSSPSDLGKQQEYLEKVLNSLNREMQDLWDLRDPEESGASGTRMAGKGPRWKALTREISIKESQIAEFKSRLNGLLNKVDADSRASPMLTAIYFLADGQYGWAVGAEGK